MRRLKGCFACLLLLPLPAASCASAHGWQPVRWESRDGRGPAGLSESSDCRTQARRQAEQRYPRPATAPPLRPGARMAASASNDAGRFPAENALYAQCMRHKGFELVDTARSP
ncbi:MAG TPA: hypothetical protein VE527_16555 [Reyranella sp.]|nr:hypothetical protein [Reyranella sp.]